MRSKTAPVDLPSYPSAQALIEVEAGRIFLNLETKSFAEVAYMFGLDRYLANEGSMRSAITRAYNLVLDNPSKYEILPEKAAFIQGVVSSRGIAKRTPETVRQEVEAMDSDISKSVTHMRTLSSKLVRRKLEYLDKNPKALKEMSLKELIGAFHILFDKGQIVAGLATENIAVLSNIDMKMNPDEALAAIVKMREELTQK